MNGALLWPVSSDRGSRLHFLGNVNDHRVGKIGNNVAERVCQYHFRCEVTSLKQVMGPAPLKLVTVLES